MTDNSVPKGRGYPSEKPRNGVFQHFNPILAQARTVNFRPVKRAIPTRSGATRDTRERGPLSYALAERNGARGLLLCGQRLQ